MNIIRLFSLGIARTGSSLSILEPGTAELLVGALVEAAFRAAAVQESFPRDRFPVPARMYPL